MKLDETAASLRSSQWQKEGLLAMVRGGKAYGDKKGTTRNDRELGNFSYWQFLYALRAGYIVFPLIIMNLLEAGIKISCDAALSSFCHCEPAEGRCGNHIHLYPHLCLYLCLCILPKTVNYELQTLKSLRDILKVCRGNLIHYRPHLFLFTLSSMPTPCIYFILVFSLHSC